MTTNPATTRVFARCAAAIDGASSVARAVLLALLVVSICSSQEKAKEDREKNERRRAQLLEEMRGLAQQTKVRFAKGEHQVELVKDPVFRYDDQPRRFIDATMWVWTEGGRPVAFQKIEAKYHVENGRPQWGLCFASTADDLLSVQWTSDRTYGAKAPGIVFKALPEGPAVAVHGAKRKRQLRELARSFSARVVLNPSNNTTQEMRLLTTPIFEYTDPKTKALAGAVFGFSTNGTNPDLLVLLEARGEKDSLAWHFAPARMTSGGVTLTYGNDKVWQVSWVNWTEAPFSTWTFFALPRVPVRDE